MRLAGRRYGDGLRFGHATTVSLPFRARARDGGGPGRDAAERGGDSGRRPGLGRPEREWEHESPNARGFGYYEAVIYYTCPKADIGSTVELSFNGSQLEGTLQEANDPPLRGAENDRVPRKGESYVKDFKPWRMGTVALQAGRGPLTLRALSVAGNEVMDVRAVYLTLVE